MKKEIKVFIKIIFGYIKQQNHLMFELFKFPFGKEYKIHLALNEGRQIYFCKMPIIFIPKKISCMCGKVFYEKDK